MEGNIEKNVFDLNWQSALTWTDSEQDPGSWGSNKKKTSHNHVW